MLTEIKVKKKVEISKEDFRDYQRIQYSGVTNMFDVKVVIQLSCRLTREKCVAIMENYDELTKEYPTKEQVLNSIENQENKDETDW